ARLAYLGQVITAGGSFPSLRDLADYGATLAFDDAENLSDERRTDPDKRTLLLAGNRRGSAVPLKELGPDQKWRLRYVNTFCPRLFSATRIPDPILASRTIVVPLIRTAERGRANVDPEDAAAWPHDRRALIDDCWALAVTHLAELPRYEAQVNERAGLIGRSLEPWRALLAVAAWLDDQDGAGRLRRVTGAEACETGLFERMEALSRAYQAERTDLETSDLMALVIEALSQCGGGAVKAIRAVSAINGEGVTGKDGATGGAAEGSFVVTTKEVQQAIADAAGEEELEDAERLSARKVGRMLGRMRLRQEPRPGGKGGRRWRVGYHELARWRAAYGLDAGEKGIGAEE
ncbi:MAG TPA: hypothetical protein VF832_02120, partial [Longimicrobiales bacterium]